MISSLTFLLSFVVLAKASDLENGKRNFQDVHFKLLYRPPDRFEYFLTGNGVSNAANVSEMTTIMSLSSNISTTTEKYSTTKIFPEETSVATSASITNIRTPTFPDDSQHSVTTSQPTTTDLSNWNVSVQEDFHRYYSSRFVFDKESLQFWVNEETMYQAAKHATLSESYRSAATVSLSFPFMFYGHELTQVTIATGGFLYMSDFLHQWLTATQYIAPLMANFDTQLGNNSFIRYMDNGTVFVVWWEDVYLQDDHPAGHFSFQVMLQKSGTIVFSYKKIPVDIQFIKKDDHPVKVGLSDAYMIDFPAYLSFFNMRQRTIYEYHRVEINMSQIVNTSSVIITPLKSCISMKTCFSCVRATTFLKDFNCNWCPSLAHCSDGLDRKRQEWLGHGCDKRSASTEEQCAAKDFNAMQSIAPSSGVGIAGVVLLSMLLILILSIIVWVVYAYRNPTTRSGLWLIEHHPGHIVTGIHNMFVRLRGGLTSSNKYQVAMQPEVESLA